MELTEKRETFYYTLKKGAHTRNISIIFLDGRFETCVFDFSITNSANDREDWFLLAKIAKEINELEIAKADELYKKENSSKLDEKKL